MQINFGDYKHILVVAYAPGFDIDLYGSAIALAKLLGKQQKATIDLHLAGSNADTTKLSQLVRPEYVNFLEQLSSDYIAVNVKRNDAVVETVKWQENGDNIEIQIYTKKGSPDTQDYSINPGKPHYDLVITLGVHSEQEVEKAFGEFKSVLDNARTTIAITLPAKKTTHANYQHYSDSLASSYAETIFDFCQQHQIALSPRSATELISCLLWKTNSFRNSNTTANTIQVADQLVKLGGQFGKASTQVTTSRDWLETKAITEIYTNLRITEDQIAVSSIEPETAKQLYRQQPISPTLSPLFEIKSIKAGIVAFPTSDKTCQLLIYAPGVNLHQAFSQQKVAGNDLETIVTFDLPADRATDIAVDAIAKSIRKNKQSSPKTKRKAKPKKDPKSKPPGHTPAKQLRKEPQDAEAIDNTSTATKQDDQDPLPAATEEIKPQPAPTSEQPKPLFGLGGGSSSGGRGKLNGPI